VAVWTRNIRSFQFFIDFTVTGKDGTEYAAGTSSWTVMDERSRRPVKRPDIVEALPIIEEAACPRVSLRKIVPAEGAPSEFSRTVHSYDIDFNGHLNNVRYIGGALEAVPAEYRKRHNLQSVHIKYIREALEGDHITCRCFSGRAEEGEYFYHRLFNQRGEDVAAMNTFWY
jgi:medium-chain acyl-[acyl-carrier-protein] hydrolase